MGRCCRQSRKKTALQPLATAHSGFFLVMPKLVSAGGGTDILFVYLPKPRALPANSERDEQKARLPTVPTAQGVGAICVVYTGNPCTDWLRANTDRPPVQVQRQKKKIVPHGKRLFGPLSVRLSKRRSATIALPSVRPPIHVEASPFGKGREVEGVGALSPVIFLRGEAVTCGYRDLLCKARANRRQAAIQSPQSDARKVGVRRASSGRALSGVPHNSNRLQSKNAFLQSLTGRPRGWGA